MSAFQRVSSRSRTVGKQSVWVALATEFFPSRSRLQALLPCIFPNSDFVRTVDLWFTYARKSYWPQLCAIFLVDRRHKLSSLLRLPVHICLSRVPAGPDREDRLRNTFTAACNHHRIKWSGGQSFLHAKPLPRNWIPTMKPFCRSVSGGR